MPAIRLIARDIYYGVPLPASLRGPIRRIGRYILGFRSSYRSDFTPKRTTRSIKRLVSDRIKLDSFLTASGSELVFPAPPDGRPKVSVIIPAYNNAEFTLNCLRSIALAGAKTSYDVIVVDDCSFDETEEVLKRCRGIRVIHQEKNSGFIAACNAGSVRARGEYLYFLNNDTVVIAGWLDELYLTFQTNQNVGIVGSRLIYPNGQLQEAGGIIWRDGSAWNCGNLENPDNPEFCYRRDVDYVSGASLMIPRQLFEKFGGFDSYYSPAYYEDSDLAFKLRASGWRVVYQPFSTIIHYEGISSGISLFSGVKQHQLVNHKRFVDRWRPDLDAQRIYSSEPWLAKERGIERRLLIVDAVTPRPDHDAGSKSIHCYIRIFQSLGYKVTFLPDDLAHDGEYTEDLQRLGVECIYSPYCASVKSYLKSFLHYFDIVLLCRPYIANQYIKLIREISSKPRVIYDTVDLHFIREQRQALVEGSSVIAKRALRTRDMEMRLVADSDAVIAVSPLEKSILLQENPRANVHLIQLVFEPEEEGNSFEDRRDLVFIGNYLHSPNVDAVIYFAKNIFPHLRERIPGVRFIALGANPTPEVIALECDDIKVPGYQRDISPYFNDCRLMVAPLRYGAGIKGKIGLALSFGVPCVATPVAAEGMSLEDGRDVLIANGADDFTNATIQLYEDKKLWLRIAAGGRQVLIEHYSFKLAREGIKEIIRSLDESKHI